MYKFMFIHVVVIITVPVKHCVQMDQSIYICRLGDQLLVRHKSTEFTVDSIVAGHAPPLTSCGAVDSSLHNVACRAGIAL